MPDGSELFEAAAEVLGLKLVSVVPTAGGDINSAWKLGLGDGSTTFLKSRAGAPPEEFEMEAAGLEWLGSAGGLRVPEVLAVVREPQPGLLLEWIEPGGRLEEIFVFDRHDPSQTVAYLARTAAVRFLAKTQQKSIAQPLTPRATWRKTSSRPALRASAKSKWPTRLAWRAR